MSAKQVIHTVEPVWTGNQVDLKSQQLANCYKNSLQLALDNGLVTIAFPNISTGIYRFPKAKAVTIAIETVQVFLAEYEAIKKVLFVCFDLENYQLYQKALKF